MYFHITRGTLSHLKDIQDNNQIYQISGNSQEAILYYQDNLKESNFNSGSTYEVISNHGEVESSSPLSIHYIPMPGKSEGNIRGHLSDLILELKERNEVLGHTLALDDNDTFLLAIGWNNDNDYYEFKRSPFYRDYLTSDALKKYQDINALFSSTITSTFYYPIDQIEELEDEEF